MILVVRIFFILKGNGHKKNVFFHLKELLKLFSKSFYSFFISCFVFEIFWLEIRQKSEKSAILDIHGYACLHHNRGHAIFFF